MILLSLGTLTLSQLISHTDPPRQRPDVSIISPSDVLWRPYNTAADESEGIGET